VFPLDLFLPYRNFCVLLVARGAAAVAILFVPHAALFGFLLLSSLLISLRWRGSFNGGSDFMTLVVLTGLLAAQWKPEAGLWYIALQTVNSYFVAGVVKLRTASWRSGKALAGFAQTTIYDSPGAAAIFVRHPALARAASWVVIALECAFPLALAGPLPCAILLGGMFAFHLGNVHVFGLNRFALAWAATYPALFYCSQWR
jgi:hypothetical protein